MTQHSLQTFGQPIINWLSFNKLVDFLPPESVSDMLKVVCEELEERSFSIEQAVQSGDMDTLQMQSHTLKSVAGQYGAERLYQIASTIHELCKESKTEQATTMARDLPELVNTTIGQIKFYSSNNQD